MLDPIYGNALIESESCVAHLLPQAITTASDTVISNRNFDNDFGRYNDHHLASFIKNLLEGTVDIEVTLTDPDDPTKRITSMRSKGTFERDENGGINQGTFVIQYPEKTSDAWRERHMNDGSIVGIAIQPPNLHRVELSMLHSGYLTAIRHLGDDYIQGVGASIIREALLSSVVDHLDNKTMAFCEALKNARAGLRESKNEHAIRAAADTTLKSQKHPLLIAIAIDSGDSCLIPVLPYHPKFLSMALLPGLGCSPDQEFFRLLEALRSRQLKQIPIARFTPLSDDKNPTETYRNTVSAVRSYHSK